MKLRKALVCINVFPSLDAMEIIKLEEKGGEIEKTGSLPAYFNQATRNIDDITAMAQTIQDLYVTNRIPLNTPTILVLPSYFTREIELPAEFSREEIQVGLVSEAERFYVFKKSEPQIDWIKLNDTLLLYSAFPKAEIEKYSQIFSNLKIPLLAIDLNYFSIIRGLVATGAVADELDNNRQWGVLVITDFAFFAIVCEGVHILKSIEAPISVTMDDESSTINEIKQDFERFIEHGSQLKFILINNAVRLSTTNLVMALSVQSQMVVVEQNAETLRSRGSLDAQFPCSLEAIGGVFYNEFPELPAINFSPRYAGEALEVLHYQKLITQGMLVLNGACLILGILVWIALSLMTWFRQGELDDIGKNIAKTQSSDSGHNYEEVQKKLFMKKAVDKNIQINDFVVNAGAKLPKEMWLTKLTYEVGGTVKETMKESKDNNPAKGNKDNINVEGGSLMPEPVNQFFNDLTANMPPDMLEIAKADSNNTSDGQSYYQWIIQTKKKDGNSPTSSAGAGEHP